MSFILALDQGTTGFRALVFNHDGTVRGLAQSCFCPGHGVGEGG